MNSYKGREWMMKRIVTFTIASMLVSSMTFGTAFAFKDLDEAQKASIMALKDRGVVSGVDSEHFVPKDKISYAQTIQMLVKGFGLNMDTMRFIKQPVASELFKNVPNDAWYAEAFIIAHYNRIPIPADVKPNAILTREQFSDLLIHVLERKGDFPMIKMFIAISDEDQITPELQGGIQRLLLHKIVELDKDGKIYPKREVTRGEAAAWIYKTIQFIDAHAQKPAVVEDVSVIVERVNDDVDKITLSRGEKPNAGYGIEINSIRYEQDGHAVVTYILTEPDPDKMYAAVITVPKAVTFISSQYKAAAEPAQ
jgi:hypothetical protein